MRWVKEIPQHMFCECNAISIKRVGIMERHFLEIYEINSMEPEIVLKLWNGPLGAQRGNEKCKEGSQNSGPT